MEYKIRVVQALVFCLAFSVIYPAAEAARSAFEDIGIKAADRPPSSPFPAAK